MADLSKQTNVINFLSLENYDRIVSLMNITNDYQAAYIARLLNKRGNGINTISAVLSDATVYLNPHQIHAALFALTNPYLKGAILADEVGLGKTIEAGIVIAQKRAEGAKNIIIVCPATLKAQWAEELREKFDLASIIVESGDFANQAEDGSIAIVSYEYAYKNESALRAVKWDLAVFDEAHKLRNVFQERVIASSIYQTFKDTFKLLLTATPLQNSLLELYGIASFIDENLFGDLETFKENFIVKDNSQALAERLGTICVRTLRHQVLEYIKFTDRYSVAQEFEPTQDELKLYTETLESNDKPLVRIQKLKRIIYQTKLDALTKALNIAFVQLKSKGANEKAVIFTESLASQDAIVKHLQSGEYSVAILNGDTKDRKAVIDLFRDQAQILVSTEVGGEGLNLQFCSLVVNFDLPWNPQRIEQRIGRCHRYGQKHDVAVINLLAKHNYAEARLYELLDQKLKLFQGVFGASDTVLGVLEDVDFEKRITNIFTSCRTNKEIDDQFATLQKQLESSIKERQANTKAKVFQYLDKDVAKRFKDIGNEVDEMLSRNEKIQWQIAKRAFSGDASFHDEPPPPWLMLRQRTIDRKTYGNMIYRLDRKAEQFERFMGSAISKDAVTKVMYGAHGKMPSITYDGKAAGLANLQGINGTLFMLNVRGQNCWTGDPVLIGRTQSGDFLDEATCEKIIMTTAKHVSWERNADELDNFERERRNSQWEIKTKQADSLFTSYAPTYAENKKKLSAKHLDEQIRNLEATAKDKIRLLEKRIAPILHKIESLKTASKKERDFEKKLALLDELKKLESELAGKRMAAFETEGKITAERDALIDKMRATLVESYSITLDFVVEFDIL